MHDESFTKFGEHLRPRRTDPFLAPGVGESARMQQWRRRKRSNLKDQLAIKYQIVVNR
jgi:hypothetical protein